MNCENASASCTVSMTTLESSRCPVRTYGHHVVPSLTTSENRSRLYPRSSEPPRDRVVVFRADTRLAAHDGIALHYSPFMPPLVSHLETVTDRRHDRFRSSARQHRAVNRTRAELARMA
jgi:hypothetical protein